MDSTEEIFDVVNAQDEILGQAPRRAVHAQGLLHRAVHIFLFNQAGELYIQKRCGWKDTYPGCYDSSASGHLDSGEGYDACAVRELREELSLVLWADQLTKQFKLSACPATGWEFVWLYSAQGAFEPLINPDEIESGRFWSRRELTDAVARSPERFARSFCLILGEFLRKDLWPASH